MSHIEYLTLHTGFSEHVGVAALNELCKSIDPERGQQFSEDTFGGTHSLTGNHFPWPRLAERLTDLPWRSPDTVLLIVETEQEPTRVYTGDGRHC